MDVLWQLLVAGPWVVFVFYWLASARGTSRTVSQEPFRSRYGTLALEVVGYVLLFTSLVDFGFLGLTPLTRTYTLAIAGVVLTWIGIAIALWARWHLGRNWSARVTLKEDHKLIRTGPYARFRHPIYSGLDLAVIGGALAKDRWHSVLGAALIILGYWLKARKEESMLSAQFGDEFAEHARRTGFLIPRL